MHKVIIDIKVIAPFTEKSVDGVNSINYGNVRNRDMARWVHTKFWCLQKKKREKPEYLAILTRKDGDLITFASRLQG